MNDEEYNGHFEIAEQARDYIAHLVADEGDPTGKLADFHASLGFVLYQHEQQLATARTERDEARARAANDDITLAINQRACEAIGKRPEEALDEACARVVTERDEARAEVERMRGVYEAAVEWSPRRGVRDDPGTRRARDAHEGVRVSTRVKWEKPPVEVEQGIMLVLESVPDWMAKAPSVAAAMKWLAERIYASVDDDGELWTP